MPATTIATMTRVLLLGPLRAAVPSAVPIWRVANATV